MNDSKSPRRFRTVFGGGYSKADVNAYLSSVLADAKTVEETLKNTINRQKTEIDDLRTALDRYSGAEPAPQPDEELRAALASADAQIAALREQLAAAEAAPAAAGVDASSLAEIFPEETEDAALSANVSAAEEALEKVKSEQTAAEEALEKVKSEQTAAEEALEKVKSEQTAAEEALEKVKSEQTAAEEALEKVKSEQAAAEAELAQIQSEVSTACGRLEAVQDAVSASGDADCVKLSGEDYRALCSKAEQYDRMSARVGAVMLSADVSAEEILRRARKEAEELVAGVNAELSAVRAKANAASDTILETVGGQMQTAAEDSCARIADDLRTLYNTAAQMSEASETAFASIRTRILQAESDMKNAAVSAVYAAAAPRELKAVQDHVQASGRNAEEPEAGSPGTDGAASACEETRS